MCVVVGSAGDKSHCANRTATFSITESETLKLKLTIFDCNVKSQVREGKIKIPLRPRTCPTEYKEHHHRNFKVINQCRNPIHTLKEDC